MSFFARIFGLADAVETRDRVKTLETSFRRLEEEWTEMYGKIRTLQMRVAKQVQRLDENSSLEEPQGAGSDGSVGLEEGPPFTSLSPRQAKIQREIIERRNRKGV